MASKALPLTLLCAICCAAAVAVAAAWRSSAQGRGSAHPTATAPLEASGLSAAILLPPAEVRGALVRPGAPSEEQASRAGEPKRSRNLDKVQELKRRESSVGLLGVVMNSVADVLESEGLRIPLQRGIGVRPGEFDHGDEKAIVRQGPDGAFLLVANRSRFPLLFELAQAREGEAPVSEEQWQAAIDLARSADLAARR